MKRRSFETYLDIARVHLLPAFGTMKLKNLTREKVQQLYTQKRTVSPPQGYAVSMGCSPPPSITS